MSRCLFLKRTRLHLGILVLWILHIETEPLRLNNADPLPVWTSLGGFNYSSIVTRRQFYDQPSIACADEEEPASERFTISISPFWQSATTGTNYRGNSTLTYFDNTNQNPPVTTSAVANGSATASNNQTNTFPIIENTIPMPLGAIPEPFNMLGIFYPANHLGNLQVAYPNGTGKAGSDSSHDDHESYASPQLTDYDGIPYKVLARTLGLEHGSLIEMSNTSDVVGDLMYGYQNYANYFYNVLAYPPTKDPGRLFGYGYFDFSYKKYGVRMQCDMYLAPTLNFRMYTGIAHLEENDIKIIDTTQNYQGPVAANMYVRYPNQLNQPSQDFADGTASQANTSEYINPNTYQLTNYSMPILLGFSKVLGVSNGQDDYSLDNVTFSNQLKSMYLQTVQNNMRTLQTTLKQSFAPFEATGFEDLTFELYYRNINLFSDKNRDKYAIIPIVSGRVTLPTSNQVPPNQPFAKSLANNGHVEIGGNLGCVIDFLNRLCIGFDFGASWFNAKNYFGLPVPTNYQQEGIYPYQANVLKKPGIDFTLGAGMQADHFLERLSFFGEYRFVHHVQDEFIIHEILSPFNIVAVNNIEDQGPQIPINTIFVDSTHTSPLPFVSDVDIIHMQEISAWTVHMGKVSFNFDINDHTSLGIAWQQPFALVNAFNTGTLLFSLDMKL